MDSVLSTCAKYVHAGINQLLILNYFVTWFTYSFILSLCPRDKCNGVCFIFWGVIAVVVFPSLQVKLSNLVTNNFRAT